MASPASSRARATRTTRVIQGHVEQVKGASPPIIDQRRHERWEGVDHEVLILGHLWSGGAARGAGLRDRGHEVVGIDSRPWEAPPGIEVHAVDLRKRAAEDVFRTRRPEAVVHMATVTSLRVQGEERHRINLGGTRVVFEHCRTYGVKHTVFWGGTPSMGRPRTRRSTTPRTSRPRSWPFPGAADLVAADLSPPRRCGAPRSSTTRCCVAATRCASARARGHVPERPAACPWSRGTNRSFSSCTRTTWRRRRGHPGQARAGHLQRGGSAAATPVRHRAADAAHPHPDSHGAAAPAHRPLRPPASSWALNHLKYPIVVDARSFREAAASVPLNEVNHRVLPSLPLAAPAQAERGLLNRLEALGVRR